MPQVQSGHDARVLTDANVTEGVARKVSKPRLRGIRKRKFGKTFVAVDQRGCMRVHIGKRLRSPNGGNFHWAEKKAQRETFERVVANVARPFAVKEITFIRWSPRMLDAEDNLHYAFKWYRDAACKWLGLPNDGPTCGVKFTYEQHKQPEYGITLIFK